MGWKGTLRSIQAAQRRAEREALRRRRELERQRKQLAKMQELQRAAYEVQVYENYIELLLSVHKQCGPAWDWEDIQSSDPPVKPEESHGLEKAARARLTEFKPGFFDKLLGRAEKKQQELARVVEKASEADQKKHQEALKTYEAEYVDWEATRELAGKVLTGEMSAYFDALRQVDPLSDIKELGSSIQFQVQEGSLIEATLQIDSEEVIPSETKRLLQSGKLSVKKMTKSKFYELYQDYVCSCALRVAREVFALLPIEMFMITTVGELLNTQTGHMEEQSILSVAIPRATLEKLNFDMIDPSDSMNNFVHRMKFLKTKGFRAVERLKSADLQPS